MSRWINLDELRKFPIQSGGYYGSDYVDNKFIAGAESVLTYAALLPSIDLDGLRETLFENKMLNGIGYATMNLEIYGGRQ